MKILKYLLYLIIALVVIFFAMGMLKSSVSYGHTITVDKPVEEAWAVSKDESKYTQWLEGFKSEELLSGEKGMPGSTYKVVVNPGEGQEDFVMTETIVDIKENEMVELHFDSESMDFEQVMTFNEEDGKTTIKTESKVMGNGIVMRSMFACMETFFGAFDKQEAKNMEALKKLINENETDYFPEPVQIDPQEATMTSGEAVMSGEAME